MTIKTVAGPFAKDEAIATAKALGNQFSAYGVERKDADGYGIGIDDWYVEQDDSIVANRLFGMSWDQIQAKQGKRTY